MKMKKYFLYLLLLLFAISCVNKPDKKLTQLSNALEKGFVNPHDTIQTSVYWYWISDNISEDGVVKDLHAMKEAGINRAFIGNIGIDGLPYGDIKILSDEWWKILHLALKTATELDIEIGIFNSPGWSQSGGPWIKPEESMRYLTSSLTEVSGPGIINKKLKQPKDNFQDVKVIAFPSMTNKNSILNNQNTIISSAPFISNLSNIFDGDKSTTIRFPNENKFQITFKTNELFTARSLTIQIAETPLMTKALLEAKKENGDFVNVSEFTINRSNVSLNVGFEPFAPVVISLPDINASEFRLTFTNITPNSGLAEVALSSVPRVERYSEKTLAKMYPTPLPYWDAYMWPQQPEPEKEGFIINENEILDITQHLSDKGILNWNVPDGNWIVMRMGMTPTGVTNSPASPEATGLEVDKMSKKWVAEHFDRFIGEILRKIPEADRKTFKVVVQDSYETGGQNFTDGFLEEFKKKYGYDPVPYLPVYRGFVVNSQLESDRFLWDLRRLVADKVAYDYVGGLREVSHQHGLTTWLENYGHWGFPGEFLMYGGQSDEIGGEFWSEGELGDIENRAATSAGHIYGKTKISAESNTSGGPAYSRYPAMMKQRTDRFFAEGINNSLLHVYIMQPYEEKSPGVNAWFGNEFDRKNTWFSHLDLFTQYLKRSNFMLQQGLNVADVAYFIGEDAPKMTGITDPPIPVGYQFDYINAEVIVRDMTVEDGLLTLPHGTQYRVLVLPKQETMRPEVLKKIKELIFEGATVIGPAPERSPSLQNQPEADNQIKLMVKEVWGEVDKKEVTQRQYGKGWIIDGMTMEEVFEIIDCVPDCKLPEDNSIHYCHRNIDRIIDIYFITNQVDIEKIIFTEFRVTGMQPELWDATSGKTRILSAYEQRKESTIVPIKLAPYESAFIVFRHSAKRSSVQNFETNYPQHNIVEELKGPWNVTFDASKFGSVPTIVFETLQDWTTFEDEKIKYYSGEANYQIQFSIPKIQEGESIIIDLGNLTSMAKVYINEEYAGGVWTPPYELDISKFVKIGINDLQVKVVNNWMNRLIGDQNLPENERETWCLVNPYHVGSQLQPSGLFGPVSIKTTKY